MTLTARVALVTGGTRGIGAQISKYLMELGYIVVICGRNPPADPIAFDDCQAEFIASDIREPEAVSELIHTIIARLGRLDLVVNNAGGAPYAEAAATSPRFSERVIQLNLLAPLHVSTAAYPHLKRVGGSIVNICSVSGVRPSPGTAAYGAAKAGLLSLTTSLAQEWGPEVRVNAIIVGLIETENTAQTYGSEAAQDKIAASVPAKRLGKGIDIAKAVAFLGGQNAEYVSGAMLQVHGGGERPLFLEIVKTEAGLL